MLTVAALIGMGMTTTAHAASAGTNVSGETSAQVAEFDAGTTGRVTMTAPRLDQGVTLISDNQDTQSPQTRSSIRVVGVPFFPTDTQ